MNNLRKKAIEILFDETGNESKFCFVSVTKQKTNQNFITIIAKQISNERNSASESVFLLSGW